MPPPEYPTTTGVWVIDPSTLTYWVKNGVRPIRSYVKGSLQIDDKVHLQDEESGKWVHSGALT